MVKLFEFSTSEMLNDRAESVADLETCQRLYNLIDQTDVDGPRLMRLMEDRIIGNKQIIKVIDEELTRRGVEVKPIIVTRVFTQPEGEEMQY